MRRISPILLAVLLFLAAISLSPSFAQQETANEQSSASLASGPTNESGESTPQQEPPAAAEQPKLITAIEVKGNKLISTNTIVSKIRSRIGGPYQETVLNDDLKRLYLLGFFDEGTKIDTQPYKDGIKLIITVVERPLIEKITFSGMKRISFKDEKLKEMIKSKETQSLDYPSLKEDVRTLEKLYEKIGYTQVTISYQVDVDKQTNKAKVQFNVVEGKKITIKDISVEGNKAFPAKRILKLIKTRRGWLFNAGVYKEEVMKEDIERVKAFYRREGFADVQADYEVRPDTRKAYFLYITIRINEGKKYLVGNVSVSGNRDVKLKDVLSSLKFCTTGKVFSQEAMKADIAGIQSLYFNRGYIMAQAQEATVLNPDTGRIDIAYYITENEVAYVDKVKVKGNIKTKDIVVRRELRIRPGDKFDGEKLRRSKERLQNLGYFEEISYDTQDTAVANKKDLVVEVKEAKTGAFSFGGGYSTVDQFVGFAEIEQKNFDWKNFPYFTGAGQDLRFRAALGSVSNAFDISFTEPWAFDYPISMGFDAYIREHKREENTGYGYDDKVTGGDLRVGKELTEYWKGDLTYRYESIKITNLSDGASADLVRESGTNAISSMELGINFDNRDNVLEPTKGNFIENSFKLAGGPFGASKDFWKYYLRASRYFPLFLGSVLEVRGRMGLAEKYSDTGWVPIYERYFAGGAYTIRGYDERKVGPIDQATKDPLGGDSMLIGNIEYLYPLFSFLKVATFCDMGNVWSKMGDIGSGGIKYGAGFGVRLKTPIGPIALDYGIPFNKEPGEENKKGGKFHFSMSHGF